MIDICELNPSKIEALNRSDSLYVIDFRSLAENPDYEIPTMWKYENLPRWIARKGTVVVNQNVNEEVKSQDHTLLIVPTADSPKVSLGKRLIDQNPDLPDISYIWTPVPHQEIDLFAEKSGFNLNYSYLQFQHYNNKLEQKRAVKSLTPEWHTVNSWKEIKEEALRSKVFLKRAMGAGGFTVFTMEDILHKDKAQKLYEEAPSEWYIEKAVRGKPMSVQCYKIGSDIIVFGIAEQIIKDKKEFIGGRILPLKKLRGALREGVTHSIEHLSVFLNEYEGFFGMDFMYNQRKKEFYFLEANVRLTEMSIPTLMKNQLRAEDGEFYADSEPKHYQDGDIILTSDTVYNTNDLLRLSYKK